MTTAVATKTTESRDLSRGSRRWRLLLVMVVINLHITRNFPGIGSLYYVVIGAVTLIALLDYFALTRYRTAPDRHWLATWVLLGLTGFTASLATISFTGSVYGLTRFWFALPLYVALLAYCRDRADLVHFTRMTTYFFTIAVVTIPIQVLTGPIQWFKEGSERGEFARYASLLGGLNAAGGTAGAFIVLCQLIPGWKKWLFTAVISASVLMDLSKSGIVSTVLGLAVVTLLNVRRLPTLMAGGIFAAGCAYFVYTFVPSARMRLETSLISFGVQSDSGLRNSDKTVTESATSRLTELPLHNIETWLSLPGFMKFPLGGGFGMASTALVPPADSLAPMSHNQFVEILTVWGIVGVVALGVVFVTTLRRLALAPADESRADRALRLLFLLAFLLVLGRYTFANGSLYHPASATPMFLCLFAAAIMSRPGSTDAHQSGDVPQGDDRLVTSPPQRR